MRLNVYRIYLKTCTEPEKPKHWSKL